MGQSRSWAACVSWLSAMMSPKPHLSSRKHGRKPRGVDLYLPRQRFLIVCEGKRTEPNYFECFRAPGLIVEPIGIGCNTLSLVREALKLRTKDRYDQVWCVFDRDENPAEQFNAALELARRNDVRVAYSNQAFELWYLLHFQYLDTSISRQDYVRRLERLLGHKYEKNSEEIYVELLSHRGEALQNAQRLLETYQPVRPADDDPSTTVHLLVEQLLRYAGPVKS